MVRHCPPRSSLRDTQAGTCVRQSVTPSMSGRVAAYAHAHATGGGIHPDVQVMQEVWPTRSRYVPPAHGSQLSLTATDASVYVPLAHGVWSVLPVGAKWPGPTAVQSLGSSMSVALENVPPAHGSAAAAPSGQYAPASHDLHAVAPS